MSTEIAERNPVVKMVNNEQFRDRLKSVLSKHVTEEMFVRLVLNALHRNPKIADCTPTSIQLALLDAAKTGLDPDGRQASLVPRYNKNINATELHFEVGYQGMIDVAYRSGATKKIETRVIYENDKFSHWEDEDGFHFRHERHLDQRGRVRAVLAKAVLTNGETMFELVGRDELEAIAKCSPSGGGPRSGPFADQMDRKGGVRRLFKYVPKSNPEQAEEFSRVLDVDDKSYEIAQEPPAPRIAMGERQVTNWADDKGAIRSSLDFASESSEPIEEPSETVPPKKRKRRTKAELEKARQTAEEEREERKSLFEKYKDKAYLFVNGEDGIKNLVLTHDTEEDIQRAIRQREELRGTGEEDVEQEDMEM